MSLRAADRTNDDQALLERFEPVLRFTRGERFFPMSVEPYVRECSLWVLAPGQAARCLVPEGELSLERLAETRDAGFENVHYLKFIEPLNIAELARYNIEEGLRKKEPKDVFEAGRGRLARVGYGSRLLDALFTLTLLARGRVPGDTAAAAEMTYDQIMERNRAYCYYGRVVREDGWIILQYWYFYPYNNWRTGFYGANDHEADWEQVCLYLYEEQDGQARPEWVAYASHDFSGDDLRRRWDDPEVEKVGDHPVVYVGAGSHASYFQPGDYLTEIELPFLAPLVRVADRLERARQRALEERYNIQTDGPASSSLNLFRIPFVDYARGDGYAIGPGQELVWTERVVIDPPPDWVRCYRGLWGLYARDPLSGEDAPAGPMYNRDGTMRRSWYAPLGWAGLDKVPPPSKALDEVYEQRAEVIARQSELTASARTLRRQLLSLGVESEAMRGHSHLKNMYRNHLKQIQELTRELRTTRASLAQDQALLEAIDRQAERLQAGDRGPLRAHINRAHHPISGEQLRLGRVAELWAAISIGLMMIAFVTVVIFRPQSIWVGLITLVGSFLVIEAAFRRWLGQLITGVTVILACVAGVILLVDFFWPIVIALAVLLGFYIMWENLRELRS